jgi:hypothetical protein
LNIIIYIITFVIGVDIGLLIGLIIWLKQISDDITNKEFIEKLTENIPAWKLVLIDKWTDFKVWVFTVWVWLKTHKGAENGNDD